MRALLTFPRFFRGLRCRNIHDCKGHQTAARNIIEHGCIRHSSDYYLWTSYVENNYLDGKVMDGPSTNPLFMNDAMPGKHYRIAQEDRKDMVHIDFELGRIYFLRWGIYPGMKSSTRYSSMAAREDAKRGIQKAVYYFNDS